MILHTFLANWIIALLAILRAGILVKKTLKLSSRVPNTLEVLESLDLFL